MSDPVILHQTPLSFLLDEIRDLIREELKQASAAPIDDKGYLSRKEVCDLLKITLPTLNVWQRSGKIPAHRIGRRVLYRKTDIERSLCKIKSSASLKQS